MFFRGKDEHIFAVCVINLAFFWIAAPRGGKAREVAWTPICFVLDGIWDFYNHLHTSMFLVANTIFYAAAIRMLS